MPSRTTAKSSINFKPLKPNSSFHNERLGYLDYVRKGLGHRNEFWKGDEIQIRINAIQEYCQIRSGRKLQKNAAPIREAVVNLHEHHNLSHLKMLARELEEKKSLRCFQIHIHRDEGRWVDPETGDSLPTPVADKKPADHAEWIPNFHAHMIFDWQDRGTGKMMRLNKTDLSRIQDITADVLRMERGNLKVNSNRERLESIEYKRVQEGKTLKRIQMEIEDLESKKKPFPKELEELQQSLQVLKNKINTLKIFQPSWQSMDLEKKYKHLTDEQLKKQLISNLKLLKNLEKGGNKNLGI